mmetsp:Transcript_16287/g.31583  ORF Transcript_16287/g.31583 Transcript_16287/m.31583 type:complete len:257 (+) Transcript_16287:1328-2098(+)
MGELKILTTSVDIEVLTEDIGSDHRTLNVPTRATHTPGRLPGRLTRLGGLPKRKVVTVALGERVTVSESTLALGELSVTCVFLSRHKFTVIMLLLVLIKAKVHRPLSLVADALLHNALDKSNNLRNVLCNTGKNIRLTNAESSHVLHELTFIFSCMSIKDFMLRDRSSLLLVELLRQDPASSLYKSLTIASLGSLGSLNILHFLCKSLNLLQVHVQLFCSLLELALLGLLSFELLDLLLELLALAGKVLLSLLGGL